MDTGCNNFYYRLGYRRETPVKPTTAGFSKSWIRFELRIDNCWICSNLFAPQFRLYHLLYTGRIKVTMVDYINLSVN